jgi:Flp pilus assembly pilin Flp
MTEYIIVVALIAIAAIGVVTIFGQNVRALYGATTASLAGDGNVNPNTKNGNRQQYVGPKDLKRAFQNN